MGPISEEFIFRGLILPITIVACTPYLSTDTSAPGMTSISTIVCLSPIYFIIAHVHHLYEQLRHVDVWSRKNRGLVANALLVTCLQMTYTGIFGVIAGFLFVRTNNICSCVVSHVFCNIMQLPDVSFTNPVSSTFYMFKYRYVLLALHVLGLVLFYYFLFPLTEHMTKDSILWIM